MINTGQKIKLIVGVGSALIDILVNENDAFLKTYGFLKGGMTLVDYDCIERTLSHITETPQLVPGGSACNTIIGIGNLVGRARFVGKLGKDEFADLFETDLKKNNVESILFKSSTPTGRVLTIITPDAQRSMFTYLGASAETHPREISERCFAQAAIVHIEGYLIFNKDLILAVLQSAQKAGARISLDLASYTVVESEKDFLESIVFRYVDILIANEDEAYAFTGYSDEMKAIQALSKNAEIAVLKVGKRGSYIGHKEKITKIAAKGTGSAIDTTGAGDLWASGFLFGLVNNYPFDKCGELGSICGYEVCQVIGTNISEKGWIRIKNSI